MKKMNVLILGDSYSTFEGLIPDGFATYYTEGDTGNNGTGVSRACETWWRLFLEKTGAGLALNSSYSGTTICHTGYGGADCRGISFAARLDKLIEESFFTRNRIDLILVFGGTNDSWAGSPLGQAQYEGFTEKDLYAVLPACSYLFMRLKQEAPDADVYALINTELHPAIEAGIIDSAKHFGAIPIRFHKIDKINGHPTPNGMKTIAEAVCAATAESFHK